MLMLLEAYKKIQRIGFPITLRYAPGIWKVNPKSGMKEGKRMIMLQRVEEVKTKDGSVMVRWVDGNPIIDGERNYGNPNYIFRKSRILSEEDIEEALFLIGVSPIVKRGNIIVVEDVATEAKVIAERRAKSVDVDYLIYSKKSPLTEDRIISLAYAWGVGNITSMRGSIDAIKNALYSQVTHKETVEHDPQFGYDAFIEAALADETPEFMECMALITKAEVSGALAWDKRNYAWIIKGEKKDDDVQLMTIVPTQSSKRKELLARELVGNAKKKALLSNEESKGDDDDDKFVMKSEEEMKEIWSKYTKKQWAKVSEEEFNAAKQMVGIEDEISDGIAIAQMLKYFSE